MKSMTCKELGGACDLIFKADTFEEISMLSKNHGQEMAKQNDANHLEAMNRMMSKMSDGTFAQWFEEVKTSFENR